MKCILCLKIPETPIDIFGEKGFSLDIKSIISQHFWFEPKEADDSPTVICSPCWLSVETFHTFYEHVKEAHCSFQEIKPVIEVIDDEFLEGTAVSNDSHFSDSKAIPNEEIKIEKSDSADMVCNINPIEVFVQNDNEPDINIKSDSESEMPLSVLVQLHKKDKIPKKLTRRKKENTSGSCLKDTRKNQTKNKSEKDADSKEEKLHILDGKWLATCYAEETYSKPINSEELDKFLKINIELLCGICQQPVADFSCLHPHFAKYHNGQKPYVSCCGLKLKFRSQIIDHILFHKIPDYFKCPECSKVWPSRRNLKEHLATHNKNFIFHCDKCPKSFCSQTAVDRHQEIHFEEKPFKCVECQKFYATEYRLKQHAYNTHHYKKICEQCGQVFREKDTFVRHLLKHSNQPKPIFQCHLCSAQLSSKKILQKHIKFQHLESSGEQNCNLCGITVKNQQALKRHLNFVHKYQREFKCTMCDKAFKRALTLKEHMTTHTGEVLYTCPHCPKTFNSNANMHSHRKKMHRKEWEENRRHPHLGTSANAKANADAMAAAAAAAAAAEESHQQ